MSMNNHPDLKHPDLNHTLQQIRANMAQAEQKLEEIKAAMGRLEQAGMYPAIAHEQWQTRPNSQGEYLYMTFRKNGDGSYKGPDGRRKVYVGADPEQIAEARRLNRNRETWEELKTRKDDLEMWLMWRKGDLDKLLWELTNLVEKTSRSPDVPAFEILVLPRPRGPARPG